MSTTKARQTQHKPPREERKNKELQTLKKENHKLARKNAQLQKELTRAIQVKGVFEVFEPDEEKQQEDKPSEGKPCPECGANRVRAVWLAGKKFLICAECKWRKVADQPL